MRVGNRVLNTVTDKLGVVILDDLQICDTLDGVLVVYEGTILGMETDPRNLKDLGPENAMADPDKCGAFTEDACLFLALSGDKWECLRFSKFRHQLILKKFRNEIRAKREPVEMFPFCQLGGREGDWGEKDEGR